MGTMGMVRAFRVMWMLRLKTPHPASFAVASSTRMSKPPVGISLVCLAMGLLIVFALPARARNLWELLPPTPALPQPVRSGIAQVNSIRMWYAVFGHGSPVILLHGGLANSNYWALQIPALASRFEVIVLDRGGNPVRNLKNEGFRVFEESTGCWFGPPSPLPTSR